MEKEQPNFRQRHAHSKVVLLASSDDLAHFLLWDSFTETIKSPKRLQWGHFILLMHDLATHQGLGSQQTRADQMGTEGLTQVLQHLSSEVVFVLEDLVDKANLHELADWDLAAQNQRFVGFPWPHSVLESDACTAFGNEAQ